MTDQINDFLDAIQMRIKNKLPALKACEIHDGRLAAEEIKKLSNFLDLSQVSVTSRSKPAVLLSSFLNSH